MKNIHVLPTTPNDKFSKSIWIKEMRAWCNIYITSDEEIKEGDWVYNIVSKTEFKATKELIDLINDPNVTLTTNKKIILTTDQDLNKDGVQSIDDEFLEWFVKNPNCESVEVIPLRKSSGYYDEKEVWHWDFLAYKIIIPKEEPKQETLEEVIGRQFQFNSSAVIKDGKPVYLIDKHSFKIAVDNILKWQAERMYTEKEVLNFTQTMIMQYKFGNTNIEQLSLLKETLQTFKNK